MKQPTDKHETTIHQWISDLREHYEPRGDEIVSKATGEPIGWVDANGIKVANMFGAHHTVAKLIWIHQHGKMPKGQIRKRDLDAPATIDNLYDTQEKPDTKRIRKTAEYYAQPRNPEKKVSQVTGVSWWAARKRWRIVLSGVYHGCFINQEDAERECERILAKKVEAAVAQRRNQNLEAMQHTKLQKSLNGGAPTLSELEEMFNYDPDTGDLFYKRIGANRKMYSGNIEANPYASDLRVGSGKYEGSREFAIVEGKKYYVNQLVWALHHNGEIPTDLYHLNGVKTDTRIYNLSLEKPVESIDAVLMRTYPKIKPVEVEQPKPEPLEEVNEYEYMGRTFIKQPDGRFSFYSRSYDETKCGTLEELKAFVDAVESQDIMGSIAKWGELASA